MERAPKIAEKDLYRTLLKQDSYSEEIKSLISKVNDEYAYWDKVKYKKLPDGFSHEELWSAVLLERLRKQINVWPNYRVHFGLTNIMQQKCHEFDMNFGGSWEFSSLIPENHKERYLISSLMEEAISSSQMEGAATTRKVAKEMLRNKIAPRDKSQQMIFNNYQTIQFIVEHKEQELTEELLIEVHRLMTDKTLDNMADSGRFRQNDDVVVENSITHEVVHTPPTHEDLPQFVKDLCVFFNNKSNELFIHPIIKAIIIHFMVAYMHPFVDGNGRTARALFYWYMLKQGYWLTEYLSISRIICQSKASYEKSFLYAETEKNDIGYFIIYNLRVLELAFHDLQAYLKRKMQEKEVASSFLHIGNINERQAEIIRIYYDNPQEMLMVKDLQVRFNISPTTAKTDLIGLVNLGVLSEVSLNKVKKGYLKGSEFDIIVKKQ